MFRLYKENNAKNILFSSFRWGKVLSLGFLLATNLVMYFTFINAYSVDSKSVLITINNYVEASIELILITVGTMLSLFMDYFMLREEKYKYEKAN